MAKQPIHLPLGMCADDGHFLIFEISNSQIFKVRHSDIYKSFDPGQEICSFGVGS
jgi:hypothetical protein